ncbi:sialidase family protein [Amycolatopsis sp. NPDC051372]|uniref:sialidase family protein n=1 Tax=unclassified Amycolatopsis TaxID=2618356 RepID=UPI00341E1B6F
MKRLGVLAALILTALGVLTPVASAALQPGYGPLTIEPADPNRQFRAMPSLQWVTWQDAAGTTKHRLIRSFLVSADGDRQVKSRVEYRDDAGRWQPALEAGTGKKLQDLSSAQFAMVANGVATGSEYSVFESLGRVDGTRQRYFVRWTSADGGASWRIGRANLDLAGATIRAGETGRLFQGVLTLPNGDLVAPFYAGQANTHSAAYLLTMPKSGTTWTRSATPFLSATFNYSESSVTRRADGRLLMITRQDDDPTSEVIRSRLLGRITNGPVNSAADLAAASWGAAFAVKVPGAADANAVRGVAPVVNTMQDGILMLVFGRPGNNIAFSYDSGATWTGLHRFYDNQPRNCAKPNGVHPCDTLGSSGYVGVAVTGPRTATFYGDNCQSGWGCDVAYDYPHERDSKLWTISVRLA